MPRSCSVISSMPAGPMISIDGLASATSISISLSSSAPSRRRLRITWRAVLSAGATARGRTRPRGAGHEDVEDALLGGVLGARALPAHRRLALLLDRHVDQVADDRVDVLADVADLGELGRLDLDERRVGQARQAARDLGLADAGRADHEDVLRRDLAAHRLVDLLAAPAVAQRDRDGALGAALADDVAVELGDDLLRRHRRLRERGRVRHPASRSCGSGWCRCRGRRRSRASA